MGAKNFFVRSAEQLRLIGRMARNASDYPQHCYPSYPLQSFGEENE